MDSTTPLTSQDKVKFVVEYADDMKAERIETLDIRQKTSVADYFVVCSGNSSTHVNAIAERTVEKIREHGVKPLRTVKNAASDGWVLIDFGDVILHVMSEEKRQFYDLESLWAEIEIDPNLVD